MTRRAGGRRFGGATNPESRQNRGNTGSRESSLRSGAVFGAVATALVLAGCGQHAPVPATPSLTTTGVVPPEVATEGIRPPAAALPPAAEPQTAPPPIVSPAGQLVGVGAAPEGVAVDPLTRLVAVATRDADEVVLINADSAAIIGRVALPGSARHVELAAPGGPLLVPVETANALVRVELPQGRAEPPILTGTSPHDAAQAADGKVFVTNELGGSVAVVSGDHLVKIFTDRVQPGGVAAAGTAVGVIDVRQNTLTIYDSAALRIVGSTPAGVGPTHLVADRHGRMIAADTRGNAVRVFIPLPTPHEVASVAQPGGPYGITYDARRDRLWVASSGTNDVIGYDMTEPTPRAVLRFPTVQNPYTLGADVSTGRLFVAGVRGGVIQVINPGP
jgi:DNA-binding beta-propeller fold protein YncE